MGAKNTSGVPGVTWHKAAKKWQSRVNGISLGYFHSVQEAEQAVKKASPNYLNSKEDIFSLSSEDDSLGGLSEIPPAKGIVQRSKKPVKFSAWDLEKIFEYREGMLFWKVSAKPKPASEPELSDHPKLYDVSQVQSIKTGELAKRGERAGGLSNGLRYVEIYGEVYEERKVVYKMYYRFDPETIYHIDGDISNHRVENLTCYKPPKIGARDE
jgi:hypothetical protein